MRDKPDCHPHRYSTRRFERRLRRFLVIHHNVGPLAQRYPPSNEQDLLWNTVRFVFRPPLISFADVNKVSFDHIKVRLFPANDRRMGEAVYSCRSCFCSFVALINRFNLGVMRSMIKIRCARYLIRSLKQYWLDLGGINRRNI